MRVLGIVVEYNPFHLGHLYHLRESVRRLKPDGVVVVMSGHFVQRGEPAMLSKWDRAQMAVRAGVDVVLELPYAFCCQSARIFASGAVDVLASTGVVTHLSFGSEDGDLEGLLRLASLLLEEPPAFKALFDRYVSEGFSFPEARRLALEGFLGGGLERVKFLSNNILGLEYLRRLLERGYPIEPMTIRRVGAAYLDPKLGDGPASATGIRRALERGEREALSPYLPGHSYRIICRALDEGRAVVGRDLFSRLVLSAIRRSSPEEMGRVFEMREGIENRIHRAAFEASSLDELIGMVYTKRYTKTAIQRMLCHLLVGYTKEMAQSFEASGPRYLRVLGFSGRGRRILALMRERASLPLITRGSFRGEGVGRAMMELERRASAVWSLLLPSGGDGRIEVDSRPYMEPEVDEVGGALQGEDLQVRGEDERPEAGQAHGAFLGGGPGAQGG